MLRHTFIHLPGIGPHRERKLWEQGILDWDRFLDAAASGMLRQQRVRIRPTAGATVLGCLPLPMPRLLPDAACRAEKRGGSTPISPTRPCSWTSRRPDSIREHHDVTVIGALGGGKLALFVKGINLDQFPAYVAQFPLLVTFNGSQFDVPFLRAHFPQARLDQAHIDLRFVLRSLGYRGGLKAIERDLGLSRDATIQGVDGFEAVGFGTATGEATGQPW